MPDDTAGWERAEALDMAADREAELLARTEKVETDLAAARAEIERLRSAIDLQSQAYRDLNEMYCALRDKSEAAVRLAEAYVEHEDTYAEDRPHVPAKAQLDAAEASYRAARARTT